MSIRAVAFDLDGTLLNSEDVFEKAGDELLARRGHEHSPEVRGLMLGKRAEEAFAALIEHLGLKDTVEGLMEEVEELFRGHAEGRLALMPGAEALLNQVAESGLPTAVCTSSSRSYLQEMLEQFDLLGRFDALLGAEDVSRGKPHPEIYRTAAERLAVPIDALLVFEDSGTGCAAGVASGAVTVAVPNRHTAAMSFDGASFVAEGLHDPRIARLISPNA
ncbi:HAD family hydrolase [Alienimonas chondri]|uniref:Validoxylamine A 7'-phosphate phosphatase n=1 Tax=Alienimonas chondri TaxID=2681879 RepID=A0ABX1VD04_9PLAN|nr:HAD family phosphatase [Alienimonas chondri]NNJ25990.1 Validoxylamine A 7'-phosphate phosphatase [Alienimonas chondri]